MTRTTRDKKERNRQDRERYAKNKLERRKRRRECHTANPQKIRDRVRLNYLLHKIEVLSHYGGGILKCIICGEDRIGCLVLDHIEGGGKKHRQQIIGSAKNYWYWFKRNKYPPGFRTLCANCHMLYGINK